MTRAQQIRDLIVDKIAESGFDAHGLHVRLGDDTAEHRWTDDVREEIHSVAKAVCVLAAGLAADEGLVSLDAPVTEYLTDFTFGEGVGEVTLRHLLSMSSGVDLPWSETLMTDWPDLAREFLSRPSRGRVFQYSNASTYTAMAVLATGVGDIVEYLRPRLFAPLGIDDIEWERCPRGRIVAGSGIALRTEELARLGLLIRDRGEWEGRRLVPAPARRRDALRLGGGGREPGLRPLRAVRMGWAGTRLAPARRLRSADHLHRRRRRDDHRERPLRR